MAMSIVAVVVIGLAAPAVAQHGHGGGHQKKMAMPKTAAEAWKNAMMHHTALDKAIKAKKLNEVHVHAFAVRDSVKHLPHFSKGLSKDKQASLAKGVNTVTQLAKQLDAAGDSGNQAKTEALHKRFDTVLKAIERLYPAGTLRK